MALGEAAKQGFNTQPPEGGWNSSKAKPADVLLFQHTAARRRLGKSKPCAIFMPAFQHTAARRRLVQP